MEAPLAGDIYNILSDLGIKFLNRDHPLLGELHKYCSGLRSHLLEKEGGEKRYPLIANAFWEITPKYRLDVLIQDIVKIGNQLAYAIGFATLYLEHLSEAERVYFPGPGDNFFWYHIDFGLRLASSGWDRLALLLDLSYDLNTGVRCNLQLVLREITKANSNIVNDNDFKTLKTFRDGRFLDLEAHAGEGARHEATHLLSPSTRFLFEFLDAHGKRPEEVPTKLRPKAQRDLLMDHHGFYLSGIKNAIHLVHLRWPLP